MVQNSEEMEQKDLPQAVRLLEEMSSNVTRVVQLVDKMLVQVKRGEMSTANGLSFLEIKYHMLLSYLINLTYLVLKKSSGEKIEFHPSIDRLVEIRTVVEKIRPIDYKLKYQVEKLVKNIVGGGDYSNQADPNHFKANPDAFIGKLDEMSDASESMDDDRPKTNSTRSKQQKSGTYVPPKLAAVHYNGNETIKEKTRQAAEKSRRLAISGAILRELKEEYLDAPVEDSIGGEKKVTLNYENKRKNEYEEEYMTRLPSTKQETHRKRQYSTLNTLGDELTSFGGSVKGSKKRKQSKGQKRKFTKKRRYV